MYCVCVCVCGIGGVEDEGDHTRGTGRNGENSRNVRDVCVCVVVCERAGRRW